VIEDLYLAAASNLLPSRYYSKELLLHKKVFSTGKRQLLLELDCWIRQMLGIANWKLEKIIEIGNLIEPVVLLYL
jgi:hypothetical protein